jgi:nucleoside-diphosphate-sugar epimerase
LHVIFGAGGVGASTAARLLDAGHEVRMVTRSGSGPDGVQRVAADASDPAAARRAVDGAAVIYNCVNPEYHRWSRDWPPIARSVLAAATDSGAALVTMSNLYGYGPVDHPMREDDPLAATSVKGRVRAQMWQDAIGSYDRVTEARASDFFGPGLTATSLLGERCVPRVLAGQTVRTIGATDVLHSWTYIDDVARALVTLGTDDRALGRPWHVPTNPPMTMRAMVERMADVAGVTRPKVAALPHNLIRAAGLVWPLAREFEEVRYQHIESFVVDSTRFEATFSWTATPIDEALAATVEWWRQRRAT